MKKLILLTSIIGLGLLISISLESQPKFPFNGYENNPVLAQTPGAWDEGCVFLPSPFYFDGIYYLYYVGSIDNPIQTEVSIGYATSDDGYNFVKWDVPILEADETGFDSLGVGKCVVIEVDGEFRMYFNGIDTIPSPGPGKYTGYATATDPTGPWNRLDDPVISGGSPGDWDGGCLEPQSVIQVDSGYLMYYWGAQTLPIYGDAYIGMAFSSDGINWEKYDDPSTTEPPYAESDPVLLTGDPGSWDDATFTGCSVLKTGNGLEMFIAGANSDFEYGIGFATSSDGVEWTKEYAIDPYTYQDDPYAELNDFYLVGEPGVIFNADSSHYYMYYHYGIFVGEIGMATAPNLTIGVNEPSVAREENNCSVYPNPSQGIFNLQFTIYNLQSVSINIYDLQGREIATIIDAELPAGDHQVTWNAEGMPEGVYFVRIVSEHGMVNRKAVVY